MNGIKKYLNRVFIEGLSGMALGLFATLIIGTILGQIGSFVPGKIGVYMVYVASIAKSLMGAGIGVGVASKYKATPLVAVSAAVAGLIGAFPTAFSEGALALGNPGNPLSSFIAAYIAIEIGILISGKTPVDIILTPLLSIAAGAVVAFLVGPYVGKFMTWLGNLINVNVEAHPLIGGIILSVSMGMFLTLPISSAAIGVMLGLDGLAAGAATVGCCCQMIGFAVMSYRENKFGGLIAQGVGTSMLQMPNIIKHPKIWIPPTLTAAITGPLATCLFKMEMNGAAVSSGMGTCGLVGQIGVITGWFQPSEVAVKNGAFAICPDVIDWLGLVLICFVLPAILTWTFGLILRKINWIKDGDLTLN